MKSTWKEVISFTVVALTNPEKGTEKIKATQKKKWKAKITHELAKSILCPELGGKQQKP